MNGSQMEESPGGSASAIEGLPPLPKGLSGILNSRGGSWRDIEKVHRKRTRIQADLSKSRVSEGLGFSKPTSLDAALAMLRKEMVGLRQLDMSLLCQLWSLYESIQEYKGVFQDISVTLGETSFTFEEEEDEEEKEDTAESVTMDTTQPRPQPAQNSRDQWVKNSFRIPL
ncbi:leucine repeat adapter protein 25 [Salminus brasiliensis]|uniref:leucine repeat adapter protein 25 n=1 Tax=Salminus brasiliensis TaxID=930266 RepID=UPI003B82D7BB